MAHTFVMQSCLFIMQLRNKMSGFFVRATNYVNVIHVSILMICLCNEVNGSKANLATSQPWHLNIIVYKQLILFFYYFSDICHRVCILHHFVHCIVLS